LDVVAALIKLKPNSQDRVREWAETINRRKDEALATLSDEGVVMESWFQVKVEGQDYLLCFMRSESIEHARQAGKTSQHAIDAYHKQFQAETWVAGTNISATLLVDLVAEKNSG
jgi:Family of unknown function (DUF6176)